MSRQTTSQTFTEIPKLDLSLADTNKDLLLSQLRHALTEVGFLYITNYGVPEDVISDLVNILPALFSLPDEVKEQVSLHNSPHFLGYSGDGSETTAGKTDRREQFEFATELSETWTPENGESLYERLRGPNQVSVEFCQGCITSRELCTYNLPVATLPTNTPPNNPKLHHPTHPLRRTLPPPRRPGPQPAPRNLPPLPLRPTPSQTRPVPPYFLPILLSHPWYGRHNNPRRRPAQRLLRLVDLPPSSLPAAHRRPAGPQQTRRVDRRPAGPKDLCRQHRAGVRGCHEWCLQSYHASGCSWQVGNSGEGEV